MFKKANKAEKAEKTGKLKKAKDKKQERVHTESSGSGIVRVGGKEFAVNIDWYPFDSESPGIANINYTKEAITKARSYALKQGGKIADLYCVAPHIKMYGLGDHSKGHKKGIPAFASIIGEAVAEGVAWICLFEVETNVDIAYYVGSANSEGQILSDNIYKNLDEAQIEFNNMLDGSWNNIFISPDLATVYEGKIDAKILQTIKVTDIFIETLEGQYIPVKLKPVSMKETFRLYGIIGISLVSLYLGYSYYVSYQEEQEQKRIQIERDALNRAKKIDDQKSVVADPWVNKPYAVDAVISCLENYSAFKNMFIPGWYFSGVRCEDDIAIATYQRSGGTINWVRDFVGNNIPGAGISVKEMNIVDISVKMRVNYMTNGLVMYDNDSVKKYIDTFFDEYSIPVTFANSVHSGTHNVFNFKIVTSQPMTILPLVKEIPGLYLKEMKISGSSFWSISFDNYEKIQGATGNRRKG